MCLSVLSEIGPLFQFPKSLMDMRWPQWDYMLEYLCGFENNSLYMCDNYAVISRDNDVTSRDYVMNRNKGSKRGVY